MKELINIQSELKAPKSQYNKFGKYNYRSQEDILEALKPLLNDNDCTLTISDTVNMVGDWKYINAIVTISNGKTEVTVEAQAGIEKAGGMALPQAFGSASSYARKYALNGLFLIDDTKDADSTNEHKPLSKDPVKKVALTTDLAAKNAKAKTTLESMLTLYIMDKDQQEKYKDLLV